MATTWNAIGTGESAQRPGNSIPWYLWCAVLAVTSVSIGAHWDVSWHRSIGRDTFWTPAHMAIYACGVLAAISCGYLVLFTTFRKPAAMVASSVSIFGFRAPLGAFIASWGGIAMLTSAPFDNWWHNAYGLDVKIVSPPHVLLMLGVFAVSVGALILLVGEMNRAVTLGDAVLARHLQWMILYVGGLMVVFQMFFRMEYTWDVYLHGAFAYEAMAILMPTMFAVFWQASRNRWACTWTAAIYTVFVEAAVLILPLFPSRTQAGAGLPAGNSLRSAQISDSADRSCDSDGFALVQSGKLEVLDDGAGDGASLCAFAGCGGVAVCGFSDVESLAEPLFRDDVFRLQHAFAVLRLLAPLLAA
jgi:hypothetical protein